MNLEDFAEARIHAPFLPSLATTSLWRALYPVIGNESRTDPTVAAALSQVILQTREFELELLNLGLDPGATPEREVILLRRKRWGEYALLVADDRLDRPSATATLSISQTSIELAVEKWQLALRNDSDAVGSLYRMLTPDYFSPAKSASVFFIRRPPIIRTCSPVPAWVVTSPGQHGRATAGCLVRHADGIRAGVTSVRHFFPPGVVTGSTVEVNGRPGVVGGDDLVSDSVFVHMPFVGVAGTGRGHRGWLSGVAPRLGERAVFEGATSSGTTAVMGQDPGVTIYSPHRQARIYTAPVTNPGDSGAALIEDSTDLIMGFAMERTAAGALVEWSSWIWADSVFRALQVTPA